MKRNFYAKTKKHINNKIYDKEIIYDAHAVFSNYRACSSVMFRFTAHIFIYTGRSV
ncbi:MAG: hypothetical protein LBQ31_06500 [Bacteroidales bacterium]|nr:hypothetical protein [Bacteroidales bacterium]